MLTDFTQRWNEGRCAFVRPETLFSPRFFEIAPIDESAAKNFVVSNHYAKSYPAARRRFGLFLRGALVGCAVFSHPMAEAVLTNYFGGSARESLELGRFVINDLPEAGFNCESWFFARCRELLKKEGFRGIVSFSDDLRRTDAAGSVTHQGHLGVFYAASNGIYTGRSRKNYIYLLPDGSVLSRRTISKIRNSESGADYAAQLLEKFGASRFPDDASDRARWTDEWLPVLTRKVRHPGNHRYLFPLQKNIRLPAGKPYPKIRYSDLQMSLPI